MSFSVFSPIPGYGINVNHLIISNNIVLHENFNNFLNDENDKKIFYIEELFFMAEIEKDTLFLENFELINPYIKSIIEGNINVVMDISTGSIPMKYFSNFFLLIVKYGLNPAQVTILINSETEYNYFLMLINQHKININVVCTHRNEVLFFEDLFMKPKKKKFLFLCRRYTPERLFIFLDLHKRKILENSYFSFSFCPNPYKESQSFDEHTFIDFVKNTATNTDDKTFIDYWHDNKSTILKGAPYVFGEDYLRYQHDEEVVNKFNETYISLCVETQILGDPTLYQPSEKIYKCAYYRHPFLVYSTPNFLHYWNKAGYKSFYNIIDETYDSKINFFDRVRLINNEVQRINDLSHRSTIKLIHDCQPILNHNQSNLTKKFINPKQKNLSSNNNVIIDGFLRNDYRIFGDYNENTSC